MDKCLFLFDFRDLGVLTQIRFAQKYVHGAHFRRVLEEKRVSGRYDPGVILKLEV